MSISLFPSENLWLKEEKEGRILLNLLSMSIIGPLIFNCCLGISHSSKSQWAFESSIGLASNRDFVIWFASKEYTLRWNLPFSFWIWRWIGMRSVIALMPKERDVQNAPNIYKAAFLCMFLSTLKGYKSGTLL